MRIPENPPSDKEVHDLLIHIDSNSFGELKQYLDIVNSKYLHWDEFPMRFKNININLKLLWSYAWLAREFNNRQIKFDGLALRYVQTPQIEKELHNLDMRVGGKIDLDAQMPSVDIKRKHLVNQLMEEAIASSQLEGAVTTRVVAKRMLRENRKPRDHSEQMIANNYATMMSIKENTKPNQPLTLELIKDIHKKITKDAIENKAYEGAFRTDNNVKVFAKDNPFQIIHEPPDHNEIEKLLQDTCNFANTEPTEFYLHPFVKAIVIHYMIGYIHPFNDGNGRTARALFYWYLISQRYNWLEYVAISTAIKNAPSKYARAYIYSETSNDVTYFVKFNLRQIDIALRFFEEYIAKKFLENKKIFDTIQQNPNLNIRQADVIITLSKNERAITVKEMQERYHITNETARIDLLKLVKLGYLQIHKGRQYMFILDKDKCLNEICLPDKKQIIPKNKRQTKLSEIKPKSKSIHSVSESISSSQN